MNCDELKDLLDDYLNNNLDKDNIVELEKHLKNCSDCQNELNAEKKFLELIKQLEVKKAPMGLSSNVREHLKAEKTQRSEMNIFKNIFAPSKMKMSFQIAAILLIVITASYSFIFLKSQFGSMSQIKATEFLDSVGTAEKSPTLARKKINASVAQKPAERVAINEDAIEKAQSAESESDVQLPAKELFFNTAEKSDAPKQSAVPTSEPIIASTKVSADADIKEPPSAKTTPIAQESQKQEVVEVKEKTLLAKTEAPNAQPLPQDQVSAPTPANVEVKKEVLAEAKPDVETKTNIVAPTFASHFEIVKSINKYIYSNDTSKSDNAVKKILQDFGIYTDKVDTVFDPSTHELKYKIYVCLVHNENLGKFQNSLSIQTSAKNLPNESDKGIGKDRPTRIDVAKIPAPQKDKFKGEMSKVIIYIITSP